MGKLKTLKELDNKKINILSKHKKHLEAEIMQEIEESETLKSEVQTLILKINDSLSKKSTKEQYLAITKQVRLPSLKCQSSQEKYINGRSSGMASQSAVSAIHKNVNLSEVDKFSYSQELLLESVHLTIQGFIVMAD